MPLLGVLRPVCLADLTMTRVLHMREAIVSDPVRACYCSLHAWHSHGPLSVELLHCSKVVTHLDGTLLE